MDFFTRRSQSFAEPGTLIEFYEGTGSDNRGRRLSDMLRWGANKLESSHDYIQTLFPLPERSGVNDQAAVIDRAVFDAFRTRPDLQDRLRDAFKKMLWFYGFELHTGEDGKLVVNKGHNYQIHCQNWLTRFDHNHLRITRIIRCLRVLGLELEALAFYDTISTATLVSSRSRMYWGRAAQRPLNIRPDIDDDDDEKIGPKFLRDFEQVKKEQGEITQNGLATEKIKDEGGSEHAHHEQQQTAQNGSATEADRAGNEQEQVIRDEPASERVENNDSTSQAITQNGSAIESKTMTEKESAIENVKGGVATQKQPDKNSELLEESEQFEAGEDQTKIEG